MTPAPGGESPLGASDHTAAVAFCLKHAAQLAIGPREPDDLLRRAADLMHGRGRYALASAAAHHADVVERSAQTMEGLRVGLKTAEDILEDGALTIYRPGYWLEEGMLVISRPGAHEDAQAAAQRAIAELAHAGASAAMEAGWRWGRSSGPDMSQHTLLSAIASSVPLAVRLAGGASVGRTT